MQRKKIEDILLAKKAITKEQLDDALQKQKASNAYIGDILLEKGYVTKGNLARALAEQIHFPFVEKITEKIR